MNTILLRFNNEAAFLAAMPQDFERQGETGGPLPDGVQALSIIGSLWTQSEPLAQVPGFFVIIDDAPLSLAQYVTEWPANSVQRFFG